MVAIKSVNRNRDNGMLTTHARTRGVRRKCGCLRPVCEWRLLGQAQAFLTARPGLGRPRLRVPD